MSVTLAVCYFVVRCIKNNGTLTLTRTSFLMRVAVGWILVLMLTLKLNLGFEWIDASLIVFPMDLKQAFA